MKQAAPLRPDLDVIQAERPAAIDELAKAEQREYKQRSQAEKLEGQRLANEQLKIQNQQLRQDNEHRQLYVRRLYFLVCCWVGGLFTLLFCQGFSIRSFNLSEKILLALIGGSTINFLGIFAIVVKYLFSRRDK